ncbi:cytochrome c biogenesis protein ResB [Akkermansia glycaniphila]|uniref:cytochrome c biogenesis protein ResB n=1 Tax=Akkermansia glycaniphila TaxID=1679444 RepID=UPI001C01A36B|nr:cytochrome c biogenesis protein ResB [Akkermansia glycaniphila]MBT9449888.1 cytochrome c biogenesis protein ResB [Akkermansia glycaniphila]
MMMQENKLSLYAMMKVAVMVLAAVLLLLVTGASPVNGVPQVYRSGVMLVLGGVVGVLCLYAAFRLSGRGWWRLPSVVLLLFVCCGGAAGVWAGCDGLAGLPFDSFWSWVTALWFAVFVLVAATCGGVAVFVLSRMMSRKLCLAVAHLALVAMGVGAYVDYFNEVKALLYLPVGQYVMKTGETPRVMTTNKVLNDEGKEFALGFHLGVSDFEEKYYDPVDYSLYRVGEKGNSFQQKTKVENGMVRFDGLKAIPVSDFMKLGHMPQSVYVVDHERVAVQEQSPVKMFTAMCVVQDGKERKEFTMKVNEPLRYGDWIFYLLNRSDEKGILCVQFLARRSYGDVWMMYGIGGLLVSLTMWCWWPKRKKSQSEQMEVAV